MTIRRFNDYSDKNIRDLECGEIITDNKTLKKSPRRKTTRQRNSPEKILSSYFPHFPPILVTLLLLSSALPDVLKAEHALVISLLFSLIIKYKDHQV